MKIRIKTFLLLLCFYCLVNYQSSGQSERGNKPNIVFILVDDLGYSDLGYMKQKKGILTPNIDRLAGNGMVFTHAYAAAPVCSPTRASLMTGKSPAALKITCHIPGMGMKPYVAKFNAGMKMKEAFFLDHLPPAEVTIAEVLKAEGYSTGFIGKWHLAGEGSEATPDGIVNADFHPDKQGFDINIGGCSYGQPRSYFSPFKNGTLPDGEAGEYLTDRLGDEAVNFITQNKDRPFFLNLATYTVHTPLQAPEENLNKFSGNKYYAMIDKLDQNVGKVLHALEKLHLKENTMVIFYSDNGGLWGNPPLRNNKGSLFEGGIRVPLIISWPGHIPKGRISEVPVTTVDFFPTIMQVATVRAPRPPYLEGQSLWPLLSGKEKTQNRALYWHFPHHRKDTELAMAAAIREGDWKLIKEFESEVIHLFNLRTDINESINLAEKFPRRAKNLLSKLEKWQQQVSAELPEPNLNNQVVK
ncbi:sulfatase [Dyadobacter tibetensis]|uniref:sulfatase n=1 Tax=Dyadobacter tibetensis TaxID=1211851 RepID=UPI0005C7A1CF|nr:sulfatase [Dyadobacter tibetensis]